MSPLSPHHSSQLQTFAQTHLGPASAHHLTTPHIQASIEARIVSGLAPEDAFLAVLHTLARQERAVGDEFFAYFLQDARYRGQKLLSEGLRRFLETGDLVQSVFGDVWTSLTDLPFESRAQFSALLAQRLRWKAIDKARMLQAERRRDDARHPEPVEELPLTTEDHSPSSQVSRGEQTERLVLRLMRLPERDRLLVRMHLRGAKLEELAVAIGTNKDAARKALARAIARLQAQNPTDGVF
jgi:RNA polymerase sigma factor (sigma-70 family)